MFRLRQILTALIGIILTGSVIAQDYDYVLPEDSTLNSKERPGVSLPIKGKPTTNNYYYIPSYYDKQDARVNKQYIDELESPEYESSNKTSVNVELGSSATTDFKGNSSVTTYIAPHIRHQLDEDLVISGGVIMSNTYLNGWTNYSLDGSTLPSSFVASTIYGRLEYSLSDRVTIYGAVYKNISSIPSGYFGRQTNGYGYSLGMQYKINDNSFLQIQVQRSSGFNPFSPYGGCYGYGFGTRPLGYYPW